ncbi:MAG: Stp1/IreP family PP2C-type Ser/Thr phosphatase [Parachlamydiales bacterium]
MIVHSAGRTDIGLVRTRNEDEWAQIPELHFYALADGMGGHKAGDVAAKRAVATAIDYARAHAGKESGKLLIAKALDAANREVYRLAKGDPNLKGMGTTLCLLRIEGERAYFGHVGDSRIYRMRGGELLQLTEDHSLVSQLIRAGQLRPEEEQARAYRHVVTRAVGTRSKVLPTLGEIEVAKGDLFLLCSDGLSDQLSGKEIAGVLRGVAGVAEGAERLIEAATVAGGDDNTTVIVVSIGEENLP